MISRKQKKRPIKQIANDFFDYLGRRLPQECANDEFYFLPRSETAIRHLGHLDDLKPEQVQDHIQYVRNLSAEISSERDEDLEGEIDAILLRQSMEGFIREFDDAEGWRNDPTVYIKIPLFATDQVISEKGFAPDQRESTLYKIFTQIPPLFRVAVENLRNVPEISRQLALDMTMDAIHFFNHGVRAFIEEEMDGSRSLVSENRRVLEAWEQYRQQLLQLRSGNHFAVGLDGLKKITAVSFGYTRSPEEILEIAQDAYQNTQEKIHDLARKIDRNKTRHHINYKKLPSITSPNAFMQLYVKEVQALRRFFYSQDVITFPAGEKVILLETPSYLQSLRATASYKAPLTGHTKGHGIFYITPGKKDLELISRHCPYLSAHETYPGHHILDHLRIHHHNPIRRQIESPLFYEGWACYGEQLLDELGYVLDPRQQLIQLKRQLWRNLRAMLDVKLQTGRMTLAQAAKEIQALGFSSKRAQRQVRRFCLTPGYQLCYFMGNYEIDRLREKFGPRLGLKHFHDTLLGGGEIPFHLVERRLDVSCQKVD
ncbi:MAG: DUF885 family protein [Desulfobacteraceae bacterium]|nr:DUF885 family protein [Desulfobacteraceae bacterium]